MYDPSCTLRNKGFLENPERFFITVNNRLKIFCKNLGEGFFIKNLFLVFQKTFTGFSRSLKNLDGFSRKNLGVRYTCW
jgi:hypothetical protein